MSCTLENPASALAEDIRVEPKSKKAAKKQAAKQEKLRRRRYETAAIFAYAAAAAPKKSSIPDPLFENYGDFLLEDIQSNVFAGRQWTDVKSLSEEMLADEVLFQGLAHTIRAVSRGKVFVVMEEFDYTVQCVLSVAPHLVSQKMVKFASSLTTQSIIAVEGVVCVPPQPIRATSQQVEVQVRKIYRIHLSAETLPITIQDAARIEANTEKTSRKTGEQLEDTLLNYRVLDLRTPANQGIFRLQWQVEREFKSNQMCEDFLAIHTRKLIPGSNEGLDVEMVIMDHYSEVMDLVDRLFVAIFDNLNKKCEEELEAINEQFPFEPLKYLRTTLRLTFKEGLEMLMEAGVEVDPYRDLSIETERKLGQLLLNKYGTEFYILHKYPSAIRPLYPTLCYKDDVYSNSFDVFIRGEEIISGAQRAEACGIDVKAFLSFVDSFRHGEKADGGFGVRLFRVANLFCSLNNITKTSMETVLMTKVMLAKKKTLNIGGKGITMRRIVKTD